MPGKYHECVVPGFTIVDTGTGEPTTDNVLPYAETSIGGFGVAVFKGKSNTLHVLH